MTECAEQAELFGKVGRARIEAGFDGGQISSDAGGALLLRQAEQGFGLLQAAAKRLPDDRDPDKIRHSRLSQRKQRVFGIALGYEDLNDHHTLRKDDGLRQAWPQVRITIRGDSASVVDVCCAGASATR